MDHHCYTYNNLPQYHLKDYSNKIAGPPVQVSLIFMWTFISLSAFLSCIYIPNKVRDGNTIMAANTEGAVMMGVNSVMRSERDMVSIAVYLYWCLWTTVGYDIIVRFYSVLLLSERQLFIQQYFPLQVPFKMVHSVRGGEAKVHAAAEGLNGIVYNSSYSRNVSVKTNRGKSRSPLLSIGFGEGGIDKHDALGTYEEQLARWRNEYNQSLHVYKCWAWREILNPMRRTLREIALMINNIRTMPLDNTVQVSDFWPPFLYEIPVSLMRSIFGNSTNVIEIAEVSLERIGCLLPPPPATMKNEEVRQFRGDEYSGIMSGMLTGDSARDTTILSDEAAAAQQQRAGFSQLSVVICSFFTSLIFWLIWMKKTSIIGELYSKFCRTAPPLKQQQSNTMIDKEEPNNSRRSTVMGSAKDTNGLLGKHLPHKKQGVHSSDTSRASSSVGPVMVLWTCAYLSSFAYTKAMPFVMGILYPIAVAILVFLSFFLP
eukprot:Tbor_TRINITY_DN4630_c0_g1::TRINITY_DN4630_c0_g1_i1::g.14908::m.14908